MSYDVFNYEKGVQYTPLSEFVINQADHVEMLFVSIAYRYYQLLVLLDARSPLSYHCYIETDARAQATQVLKYDSRTSILSNKDSLSERFYSTHIPYVPSEIIIYPCRGRPSLLIDVISDHSSPAFEDYQQRIDG